MSRILIMGSTGFIGRNLLFKLYTNPDNEITCFSKHAYLMQDEFPRIKCITNEYCRDLNFDELLVDQEYVFHFISTTYPATSNRNIAKEISDNIITTVNFLEACQRNKVKKVIFASSGGTVYGKVTTSPINELSMTNPINSYGIQKLTIEKLFYLYNHMHGLDYCIIRLANPYGPYQRINGGLGAVSVFINRALHDEFINVYGDGSVVRDYIYIDDVIEGIVRIAKYNGEEKIFNLGSGKGISIKQLLNKISKVLHCDLKINYLPGRAVDVPINVLDMSLYKEEIGILTYTSLEDGIKKTYDFQSKHKDGIHG